VLDCLDALDFDVDLAIEHFFQQPVFLRRLKAGGTPNPPRRSR